MTGLVDTSVFCGCWPFRPTALRDPVELKARLESAGACRAWVASAEAVFAPDPMQANEPMLEQIAGDDFFVGVAAVNPVLATWRSDAEACLARSGCRALKLFPSYHAYDLAGPAVDGVAELAGSAGVPVCVQILMLDPRSQHPASLVEAPPPAALTELALRHPGTRFLACGGLTAHLEKLSEAKNVWAEMSHIDGDQALRRGVEAMGPERIVFGSHSPYHYFEAMAAKLDVAPEDVEPGVVEKVRSINAAELLGD